MDDVAARRSSRMLWIIPPRLYCALCVAIWLLFTPGTAHAQFTRFQNYADEQGLDNLDTTAIVQDSAGYMLFGTQGGLYRFDGNTITTFGESLGLVPNWIWQIAIDPLKRPWIVARDDIHVLRDGRFVQVGDGTLFTDMEAPLLLAFGTTTEVIQTIEP